MTIHYLDYLREKTEYPNMDLLNATLKITLLGNPKKKAISREFHKYKNLPIPINKTKEYLALYRFHIDVNFEVHHQYNSIKIELKLIYDDKQIKTEFSDSLHKFILKKSKIGKNETVQISNNFEVNFDYLGKIPPPMINPKTNSINYIPLIIGISSAVLIIIIVWAVFYYNQRKDKKVKYLNFYIFI